MLGELGITKCENFILGILLLILSDKHNFNLHKRFLIQCRMPFLRLCILWHDVLKKSVLFAILNIKWQSHLILYISTR